MDAWAADDRRTALRGATQAAVGLLLRGQAGGLYVITAEPDRRARVLAGVRGLGRLPYVTHAYRATAR